MHGTTIGPAVCTFSQPTRVCQLSKTRCRRHASWICLSLAEQQRQLAQGLSLYCGVKGHVIMTCPIRPPHPVVSFVHSVSSHSSPLTYIVCLTASDVSILVHALIDSGSTSNFIPEVLCHHLEKRSKYVHYKVHSITGKPLSQEQMCFSVGPLHLWVGLLHIEDIEFLVLEMSVLDHWWSAEVGHFSAFFPELLTSTKQDYSEITLSKFSCPSVPSSSWTSKVPTSSSRFVRETNGRQLLWHLLGTKNIVSCHLAWSTLPPYSRISWMRCSGSTCTGSC